MWEAAAYSQNLFKVMLDPPTWALAAIAILALRRLSLPLRIAAALAANLIFCLLFLYWPAGDSGRHYAAIATAYEFAATGIWCAIFAGARRLIGKHA